MLYLDYKEHLQNKLGDDFIVVNYLNLKANLKKVNVVIKELAGNVYENSAQLPVQLDIYTSDVDATMLALNNFVKANNNVGFQELAYYITPFYTTPTLMENDIQIGNNYFTRIVVFGTLFFMFQVGNIKEVYIDGEKIDFLNASMSYNTELHVDRRSGQEINVSRKKASTLVFTLSTINKLGIFYQKLRAIRLGTLTGNTIFAVKFVFVDNNAEEQYNLIINTFSQAFARNQLPSLNISMVLADTTGGA
jgi:hypothetical protein